VTERLLVAPAISVVMPAFNAQRFLEPTVEALRRQSLTSWELVIVDDGSRDDTAWLAEQLASRDKRITVLRQPNAGPAVARNTGFAASDPRSRAVMFLDADDTLVPSALEQLSEALMQHPEVVASYGLAMFIDDKGEPIRVGEAEAWSRDRQALNGRRIVKWPLREATTLAVLIIADRIFGPSGVLVRREPLEAVGGFDPELSMHEDWDLWLRLACRGDLFFVDRVVVGYRLHGANRSANAKKMDGSRWYVHDKLARSNSLTDEQRRLVQAAVRYARLLSARYWLSWARLSASQGRLLRGANQTRHAAADLIHYYVETVRARTLSG
jgi:glycosyltransferase involved in cell wall biosynthesis